LKGANRENVVFFCVFLQDLRKKGRNMKYWRQFVVLSLIVVLLSLGTGNNTLFSKVTPGYMPGPLKDVKFFRVYFDEIDTAHKLVITMNAWESEYEKGYIIVEVTTGEEYDRLLSTGLKIEEIPDPLADKIAAMQGAALVQTSGIPGYPCYRTVEETFATAASIAATYPWLATWTDQGDSWEKTNGSGGYDLYVLKLTNSAVAGPKPKLFLTSAIHAREYTTAELVTRLAEYLVNNYNTDPDVTWMLDHHEIHMMLHANPDGRKKAETGLSWRKNTNTNYCGPFSNYRGADLNRNFEFKWNSIGGSSGDPCSLIYRGPYAASEPETRAIQNYIRAQFPDQRGPNDTDPAPLDTTGFYLDMHSHGREVLYQSSWTSDLVEPVPNVTELITLARKIGYFNGHRVYGTTSDGTTKLFGYGEMGIPAYTVELGTAFFQGCTYFENTLVPDNIPALLYALKAARTPYMTSAGPDTVNPVLSAGSAPPGIPAGTRITLTASMDDTRYNNNTGSEPWQTIAGAEYYIDVPPWASGPEPFAYDMSPADGNFNNPVEAAEATIDTTGWSEGRHIIFIRGQDTDGNWGAFSAVFLYINNSGGKPAAPTNLTAGAVFWRQINLAWTDNSDNETSFKIERSIDGSTFSEIDSVGANVTSYRDTTVAENTIYWYRVRAANFYGDSGYSNIDSAATPQRKLGRGKEKILAPGGKKG
jgi:carboxypeptidase T